ncbi:hypothetical protein FS842_010356 [Serendipita sp. 407]|nr:hypothetical protein FS842_010356 [Serendipita sp. 407]
MEIELEVRRDTPDSAPLADSTLNWLNQRQQRYDKWNEQQNVYSWSRDRACRAPNYDLDSLYVFSGSSMDSPLTYRSIASATLEPIFD